MKDNTPRLLLRHSIVQVSAKGLNASKQAIAFIKVVVYVLDFVLYPINLVCNEGYESTRRREEVNVLA